MALSAGTRLGPYEILAAIGAGGMGEVYRARDTKLDRDVAIKVLPGSFALDGDRVARFAREAKALASLNHPHIAAIYGIEEQGPSRALVMELVEGEDLAQIVSRGPIPVTDALPLARQIADALEAAHGQGIIHRDLKPANIKVKSDGTVKVLDFGLAKAISPAESNESAVANSPTLTARATQMGVILGTAAYMAPEQAKGRAVDKRADIWAFGALLYEMLAGVRAFKGDDVTEVLAAVIKDTVDVGALPSTIPVRLKELIARCLERDPRKRQRDAGDILLELGAIEMRLSETAPAESGRRKTFVVTALVATGALATGAALGVLSRQPAATADAAPVRLSVVAPGGELAMWPQMSPDGRVVVFFSGGRLYQRSLAGFEAVAIPGTDGAGVPMMSPDGRAIAFVSGGELKRVSLAGGDPVTLADIRTMPGGAWGPNQEILYSQAWASGLWAVSAVGGGTTRRVTEPDRSKGERGHWRPQFLPDGKRAIFTIMMASTGVNDARVAILDVSTGAYRPLFPGTDGQYLRSGHILFFHGGAWRLVPFDVAAERTTGEPVTVLQDAYGVLPDGGSIGTLLSVSDTGAVAYLPGPTIPRRELVWMDRSGSVEPVGLPAATIFDGALSPDDRRVAIARLEAGTYQLWVADLSRNTEDRVNVKGSNFAPLWDPTGEWLAFISERKGQYDAFIARPDGSGERALLEQDHDEQPRAWSRDGRILVKEWKPDGNLTAVVVDATSGKTGEIIFRSAAPSDVQLSSDDRWLLYASSMTGRSEIYVRAFTAASAAVRVSTRGGFNPIWSPNAQEVFFRSGSTLMSASVRGSGGRPEIGEPQRVFDLPPSSLLFGVSKDGKRFLVGRLAGPDRPPGVRVVLNWFTEFAAAPGK
jgi:Tol biopolymer transport system component